MPKRSSTEMIWRAGGAACQGPGPSRGGRGWGAEGGLVGGGLVPVVVLDLPAEGAAGQGAPPALHPGRDAVAVGADVVGRFHRRRRRRVVDRGQVLDAVLDGLQEGIRHLVDVIGEVADAAVAAGRGALAEAPR